MKTFKQLLDEAMDTPFELVHTVKAPTGTYSHYSDQGPNYKHAKYEISHFKGTYRGDGKGDYHQHTYHTNDYEKAKTIRDKFNKEHGRKNVNLQTNGDYRLATGD